jgi:hypothetical protein
MPNVPRLAEINKGRLFRDMWRAHEIKLVTLRDMKTKSLGTGLSLLFDVLFHLFEMVNPIVANADGADFTLIVGFYQCLPSTFTSLSTSIRSMKEHEINVSKASFFQSLLHLSLCILVAKCASRNFAGEEDIFTFESRVQDSLATSSLITIRGCRIDLKSFSKNFEVMVVSQGLFSRVCIQL